MLPCCSAGLGDHPLPSPRTWGEGQESGCPGAASYTCSLDCSCLSERAAWTPGLELQPLLPVHEAPMRSPPGSRPGEGQSAASCLDPAPARAREKAWRAGWGFSRREGPSGARRGACKSAVLVPLGAHTSDGPFAVGPALRGPHAGQLRLELKCRFSAAPKGME